MYLCVIERMQFVSYKCKSLIKLAPGYTQIEWVTSFLYSTLHFYSSMRAYTRIKDGVRTNTEVFLRGL